MQNITILGSTGSIGESTLSVIRQNAHHYNVYALVANKNVKKMVEQCLEFKPHYVAMSDKKAAQQLRHELKNYPLKIDVLSGVTAVCELAALPEVDQVMAAIVGAAGLVPTLAAIRQGKRVLLANKESLVMCGGLFMKAVKQYGAELLPIDSEHNAIFQSMPEAVRCNLGFSNLCENGVTKIILTGSGGPFKNRQLSELNHVTVSEAIAHPTWSMGKKISIDSATMMNKGLEYIEARWLFNASADEMEIIIHPQSVIHSMVRYADGSVLAQLAQPSMSIPIAYGLGFPTRCVSGHSLLDFCELSPLTFTRPDYSRYPCLKLAMTAFDNGQAATIVLNASNEVAVNAFLQERIGFTDIPVLVESALSLLAASEPTSFEEVLSIDKTARIRTEELLTGSIPTKQRT